MIPVNITIHLQEEDTRKMNGLYLFLNNLYLGEKLCIMKKLIF